MKRFASALFVAATATGFAADELPTSNETQGLEIEPPMLIQNRGADGSLSDAQPSAAPDLDVEKLESDLARATRNAASGERLFRAGIIAKVEAENRALKAVRLEAKLAAAKAQVAKNKLDEMKSASGTDESFARELKAAEELVVQTGAQAARAEQERQRAEMEAAARNVERQRKLLALGSGRKAM